MIYRNKYLAMRVTQFVAFLVVLVALQKLISAGLSDGNLTWPAILLFCGIVVGLTASVFAHYYNAKQDDLARSQKIAVETLAQLGRQKEKQK